MSQLEWNTVGERFFEAGVDRGVFYTSDGFGVVWNGLVSVSETPTGGEPKAYYLDGRRFLNIASAEEFAGSIKAFTYPYEFEEYDGSIDIGGLISYQQRRKPFGLSYRTLVGNDLQGEEHAYKIHIVYNVLASPTEKEYDSLSEEQEPVVFSWEFTTTPQTVETSKGVMTICHVAVDTRKATPSQIRIIESYLYGTPSISARLPTPKQLYGVFEVQSSAYVIQYDPSTGVSPMVESSVTEADLLGASSVGIYVVPRGSKLVPSPTNPGFYVMEA